MFHLSSSDWALYGCLSGYGNPVSRFMMSLIFIHR